MSGKTQLIGQIQDVSAPVLAQRQLELVDLEFVHEHGQWILRFFLDKPGGITLDDCAETSEHLGRILDATDLIPQSYSLEVSSPGLNRPLKRQEDFQRFTGERADITMFAPINGRRHFRGLLRGLEGEAVLLEDVSQQQFALPIANIAKAKLDPEIDI